MIAVEPPRSIATPLGAKRDMRATSSATVPLEVDGDSSTGAPRRSSPPRASPRAALERTRERSAGALKSGAVRTRMAPLSAPARSPVCLLAEGILRWHSAGEIRTGPVRSNDPRPRPLTSRRREIFEPAHLPPPLARESQRPARAQTLRTLRPRASPVVRGASRFEPSVRRSACSRRMSGGTVSATTEVAPPPQATVRNGCDDENASAFPSDKPTASLAVLLRTMRRFGGRLARLSAPSYLKRKLATNEGTDEVYAKLQAKVGSPEFLANLARESRATTEEEEEDEVTFDLFDDEPAQAADDAGDDESYVFIDPRTSSLPSRISSPRASPPTPTPLPCLPRRCKRRSPRRWANFATAAGACGERGTSASASSAALRGRTTRWRRSRILGSRASSCAPCTRALESRRWAPLLSSRREVKLFFSIRRVRKSHPLRRATRVRVFHSIM